MVGVIGNLIYLEINSFSKPIKVRETQNFCKKWLPPVALFSKFKADRYERKVELTIDCWKRTLRNVKVALY